MTLGTLDRAAPEQSEPVAGPTTPAFARRPAVIAALLLVLYLLCARVTDPGGYLGTDTGGKVATVDAMAERGDLRPDIGYWAEEWDPDGSLHPFYGTLPSGDQWVNVTNLPMLHLALPLYRLGGYSAALLVPMVGGVAAALAAGRIARRLGSPDGAAATWLVGAASPVVVYALDLWEHTLGVALMAWAVSHVLDVIQAPRVRPAVAAGLLFGFAATMRQEAFVYGAVAGLTVTVVSLRAASGRRALAVAPAMASATGLVLAAGVALESAVMGESLRAERSVDTASKSAGDLVVRLQEAGITFGGISASTTPTAFLLVGVLSVAAFVVGRAIAGDRRRWLPHATVAMGAVLALAGVRVLLLGLMFLPGMLVTWPLAGIGLGAATADRRFRAAAFLAVAPLPLVWAVQYTGGAGPQWGGRYLLTTGLVASVIAVVVLERNARRMLVGFGLVALVVNGLGVAWLVQRSHAYGDANRALAERSEPVLVFEDPHGARESGPIGRREQWLAAPTEDARAEVADVLTAAGIERFGYVEYDLGTLTERDFDGFRIVGNDTVELFADVPLRITIYAAD